MPQLPGCPATELLGSWLAGRAFGLLTVGRAARSVAGGRPSEAPLDGPQPRSPVGRCTEGSPGGETLVIQPPHCETDNFSWGVPI